MTGIADTLDEFSKRELGEVKVLIVEDDPFISKILITSLSKHGCVPYSTSDGNEAITLAEQYMPHVIILDLMLPGMNGEDILILLKKHDTLKNIPVIVFTNRSEDTDKQRVLDLGAALFLIKATTRLTDLTGTIKKLADSAKQ